VGIRPKPKLLVFHAEQGRACAGSRRQVTIVLEYARIHRSKSASEEQYCIRFFNDDTVVSHWRNSSLRVAGPFLAMNETWIIDHHSPRGSNTGRAP
jgi:hypothetical protein